MDGCPTYNEYFKEGDAVPSRLCPLHKGTVKQRVQRVVDGLLSGIGRKIRHVPPTSALWPLVPVDAAAHGRNGTR